MRIQRNSRPRKGQTVKDKMEVKRKRANAGRKGARRRWGANREATHMVRAFVGDVETLGLLASTSADAVRWLLNEAKVSVHRAALTLDTRDAKSLAGLADPGNSMFRKGVRVVYPASGKLVAISFPVADLGAMLASTRLDYGGTPGFHAELTRAADAAKGDTAVAVFPFENP